MSLNHPASTNAPTRATCIEAARELAAIYGRVARHRLAGALGWLTGLLAVSAAMSLVTAGILTRVMPAPVAYPVAALLHVAIGLGIHLLIVGMHQEDRLDLASGAACLAVGLVALVVLSVARALILVEEGRSPVLAWGLSLFLFLLETVVPGLFGYMAGRAWRGHDQAREEARFYREHQRMIETSLDPAARWNDSEDRLQGRAARIRATLPDAKPEEARAVHAEAGRLEDRREVLAQWNPGRSFRAPQPLRVSLIPAAQRPEFRIVDPADPALVSPDRPNGAHR